MALPDEIEYFLDGAAECGEMTTGAVLALRLYGDPSEISRLYGSNATDPAPGTPLTARNRRRVCLSLEAVGARHALSQGDLERSGFYELALRSIRMAVDGYGAFLAGARVDDETYGGALEHFRDHPRVQRGRPTRPALARIRSAKVTRGVVKRDLECVHLRSLWKVWENFPHDPVLCRSGADHVLAITELQRLEEAARRNQAERELAALSARPKRPPAPSPNVRRQFPRACIYGPNTRLKRRLRAYDRAAVRAERATIKRSVKIVSAILGEAVARDLAAGRAIDIPAGSFAFRLRAPRPSARAHGAVSVRLVDEKGLPLASVCVFQEAPAFDQVASIALHAAVGQAMKVVEVGNLFQIEPTALDHPVIGEKANIIRERQLLEPSGLSALPVRIQGLDELFREIKPKVIEIVSVFVFGRSWRRLNA